ncbi:dethiobiotin synthetase [Oxalobacteraceae bacterium GrIS 2.11]
MQMQLKNRPLAFFVTGTDTEIGKTLVSCAVIYAMTRQGWKSVGMKPIAAGAEMRDGVLCNEDVLALQAVSNVAGIADLDKLVNPYLFTLPAAPHIAAEQEQRQIDLSVILQSYRQLANQVDAIVVEGVGGFRVPLNDHEDSADLARQLNLPVLMVVGMRLGCINQALLTAEAIAARGLRLAGWVANCAQQEMSFLQGNLTALTERLHAPLLGCIPHLNNPDADKAAKYLDLTALFQEG